MSFTTKNELNPAQKEELQMIELRASVLAQAIYHVNADERCRAVAKTKLEECIMWINKGICIKEQE